MKILGAVITVAWLMNPASVADLLTETALPMAAAQQRSWLGPDGTLLPFETDEEALEYLSDARIVSRERIPVGVTRPDEVLLEKDGVEAKAAYKDVDETYERTRMSDGQYYMNLRDYYKFERAAYELSRMLGLDNVPPTVLRMAGRERFSLQLWIHNGMTEAMRIEEELRAPNHLAWTRQVQTMYLFDDLIGNVDRNQGDVVIDRATWKIWMIDHSRAFQRNQELRYASKVGYCSRALWGRLRSLEAAGLRDRLGEYLTPSEIDSILERRAALVDHIQSLIDERGEGAVLY